MTLTPKRLWLSVLPAVTAGEAVARAQSKSIANLSSSQKGQDSRFYLASKELYWRPSGTNKTIIIAASGAQHKVHRSQWNVSGELWIRLRQYLPSEDPKAHHKH